MKEKMVKLNNVISQVSNEIIQRSHTTRQEYLARMQANFGKKVKREQLACTNLAHMMAAENERVKFILKQVDNPNIGIITAYNDMLSAHQPYYRYPEQLKSAILQAGGTGCRRSSCDV
jgi:phosphogluconate dehydratase